MSTHSEIVVEHADGSASVVYCHFDGYPENQMPLLEGNYYTQGLADELVRFGNMSYLGKCAAAPPGHSYDKPVAGYTVYYGRDRGEKGDEDYVKN